MKLQARIAKAQLEGRRGKVRALQWTLMRSLSARLLAVRRAAGRSGADDAELLAAAGRLSRRGACAPGVERRALRALNALALEPLAWAARGMAQPGRGAAGPDAAVRRAAEALRAPGSRAWGLRLRWDARGAGEWIAALPGDRRTLGRLARRDRLCAGRLCAAGSDELARTLAELALGELARAVAADCGRNARIAVHGGALLVVCRDAGAVARVSAVVNARLPALGLKPAGDPLAADLRSGVEFAGYRLRRRADGRVEALPGRASVRALLCEVERAARRCRARPTAELVARLNPLLREWALRCAGAASRRAREGVDRRVRARLWRWALSRHPRKGAGWVYAHYFGADGQLSRARDGAPALMRLRDV